MDGEKAAVNPTGYSLLSDFFHSEQHSRVLSLFSAMVFTGQVIGLLTGEDSSFFLSSPKRLDRFRVRSFADDQTGILSESFGWRIAFLALGIPGLLYSIPFVLTVKEPKRGLGDDMVGPKSLPSVENSKTSNTKYGTGFYSLPSSEPQITSTVDRFLFIIKSPSFVMCVLPPLLVSCLRSAKETI